MGLEGLKSRKSSNLGPKRRCFGHYYTKKKFPRASLSRRLTDIEENGGEEEEEEEKRKKKP